MNTKQKKFADELVFLYFNSSETINAIEAAKTAGYDVSSGKVEADRFAKDLMNNQEVKSYIDDQIKLYKQKMLPEQRRTLWTAITEMQLGEPTEWADFGSIDYR